MNLKSICVFCGSKKGHHQAYSNIAIELGKSMSEKKIDLIYGGGSIGLMGVVADSVLNHGGKVTGVIPGFLADKEIEHRELTELFIVESMHERKQKMESLSDGFIAMPGGFGTLEELAEILTWVQLGLVKKPVGLLNINGFYDPLLHQLNQMVNEGFLSEGNRSLLIESNNPHQLLEMMVSYVPLEVEKIISPKQT